MRKTTRLFRNGMIVVATSLFLGGIYSSDAIAAQPLQDPIDRKIEKAMQPDNAGVKESQPLSGKREYQYKKFTNIYYQKTRDYKLVCDLYIPEGDGPFPAVLAIHGGAWKHGSKIQMLRHAWKMAKAGYVVVAINYRHAPQYKFPAQVHDTKMAVRWMRHKHQKLKIDPDKIAVFGYSAGGHLGAMLGTTDKNDGLEGDVPEILQAYSSRVQCVVVGGGPCEFSWVKSNALKDWLGDNQEENPEVYTPAAPISYVSNDDPPFTFFHGTDDKVVPPETAKKMHQKLLDAGVKSEFNRVQGKGHFATFSDTRWMDDAIAFMDESLNRTHHE